MAKKHKTNTRKGKRKGITLSNFISAYSDVSYVSTYRYLLKCPPKWRYFKMLNSVHYV